VDDKVAVVTKYSLGRTDDGAAERDGGVEYTPTGDMETTW